MLDTHRLIVKSLSGFGHLEHFYADFNNYLHNPQLTHLEFDLSLINFVTPEAVLALLCASRYWYQSRGTLVSLTSINEQVYQYLQRVEFFVNSVNYIITPQTSSEAWTRKNSDNLLELTPISSDPEANIQAVYGVYQKAVNLLLGRIENVRMKAACDLLNVVVENIIHSQDIGHVLMQCYEVTDGHRIHIGIADLGAGIPTTLKSRYPNIGNEAGYLLKALEMGVSSRAGMGGLGLYNADRLIRGQQGSLTIRANQSMLQMVRNKVYLRDNLTFVPGTQVYITVGGTQDSPSWQYLLPD